MMANIEKNKARKLAKQLNTDHIPDCGWTYHREKNGRGDYGYSETFCFKKRPMIVISVDGARRDVQWSADLEAFKELGVTI